jgi:hypothetical protein
MNHIPHFDQEAIFQVVWDKPTQLKIDPSLQNLNAASANVLDGQKDHISILIRAWAYILSARWTELIHPRGTTVSVWTIPHQPGLEKILESWRFFHSG